MEMRLFLRVAFISAAFVQALNGHQHPVNDRGQLIGATIEADAHIVLDNLQRWSPSSLIRREEADAELLLSQVPASKESIFTYPELPVTEMKQEGTTITLAQWPPNFCVSVDVEAPDANDISGGNIKAIALIGGQGESGGGTGKCGYFMLCFITGNAVAMGVQCNAGGSDPPLGTTQNLTSFTQHSLSFCYNSNFSQASIYVDGVIQASAKRTFVFPREGQVTLLAGSHDSDVEMSEGVSLSSFKIAAMTTTTTTTTIARQLDANGVDPNGLATEARPSSAGMTPWHSAKNLQSQPFALQGMPRTSSSQRTAMITQQEWPPDFCIHAVITTPAIAKGVRAIALFGGSEHCGNFMIFFGDDNKVGMGVQCSAVGSDPALISAGPVTGGMHALTFCYAMLERKASISVDGIVVTADDRTWNYPMYGNVSVLVGSHLNATEELSGVTLQCLNMIQHQPFSPIPLPTDMAGNTDLSKGTLPPATTLPPLAPPRSAEAIRALTNSSNYSTVPFNNAVAGNGVPISGGIAPITTTTTTTTTTTVTTTTSTIIMEHIQRESNVTKNKGNESSHTRNDYNTVTHDDSSSSVSSHMEGR